MSDGSAQSAENTIASRKTAYSAKSSEIARFPEGLTGMRYVEFAAFKPKSLAKIVDGVDGENATAVKNFADPASAPGSEYLGSIYLPLPPDISSTHSAGFENANLLAGSGNLISMESAGKLVALAAKEVGSGFASRIRSKLGAAGSAMTSQEALNSAQKAAGISMNPNTELLYTAPGMRTHQFQYLLFPMNEREAIKIDRIKRWLRWHQYPSAQLTDAGDSDQGIFFKHPSEFLIRFFDADGRPLKHTNFIFRSNLAEYAVQDNPQGQQAWIVGSNGWSYPASTSIQLTFREGRMLTREDWMRVDEYLGHGSDFSDIYKGDGI